MSAIKSKLVADDYPWDDRQTLLSALTGFCKQINDRVRTRLPIKRSLLEAILFETGRIFDKSPFTALTYKTLFTLAYYGLMRVGELTMSPHVVKAKDIHVSDNSILLVLYSSKTHGKGNRPQKIKIKGTKGRSTDKVFCPLELTTEYLQERGGYDHDQEQLFIFRDGTPITAKNTRRVLKMALKRLQLDPSLYGTHSFRIGRASDMLKSGYSVDQIKQYGRWKSNAVYKYLRN